MSMERDNSYLKEIMVHLRNDFEPESTIAPQTIKENYHIYLLLNSGFIEADKKLYMGEDFPHYDNVVITTAGHDFLDAAENDTIWNKTTEAIKDKGFEITKIPLDVLNKYLKMQMMSYFGIE